MTIQYTQLVGPTAASTNELLYQAESTDICGQLSHTVMHISSNYLMHWLPHHSDLHSGWHRLHLNKHFSQCVTWRKKNYIHQHSIRVYICCIQSYKQQHHSRSCNWRHVWPTVLWSWSAFTNTEQQTQTDDQTTSTHGLSARLNVQLTDTSFCSDCSRHHHTRLHMQNKFSHK